MNRRLRRKMPHGRPFASLVAFAWTMLLTVTLKALLDVREPRSTAGRRSTSDLYRFFRIGGRQRRPPRYGARAESIQAST